MLYLAGIFISIFLFLLLLIKKNKSSADVILAIWMAVMTIHQIAHYLDFTTFSYQYPHLLGTVLALPLLHGLLLYFYTAALTGLKKFTLKSTFPHFIPFVLLLVLAIPFYALPGLQKVEVFKSGGKGFEWYIMIQLLFILGSGMTYVFKSLLLIKQSRAQLEDQFSDLKKKNLQWLQYLSLGLAGIWVLVLFFDDAVIFVGVSGLVLLIGILGINQAPIFTAQFDPTPAGALSENELEESTPVRYAKSGLKGPASDELFDRLSLLMSQEEVFKNNELTLGELAIMLDVQPNYLSQVINEKAGKNFYNYINSLRIEAFINLAAQPEKQHYSLLALAFDCGFNSKSTFNKYFKAVTGETPSEYLFLVKSSDFVVN